MTEGDARREKQETISGRGKKKQKQEFQKNKIFGKNTGFITT